MGMLGMMTWGLRSVPGAAAAVAGRVLVMVGFTGGRTRAWSYRRPMGRSRVASSSSWVAPSLGPSPKLPTGKIDRLRRFLGVPLISSRLILLYYFVGGDCSLFLLRVAVVLVGLIDCADS